MVEGIDTFQHSSPSLGEGTAQVVSWLIQEMLAEDLSGTAYHQQLLQALEQLEKQNTVEPDVGALPALTCRANDGDDLWTPPLVTAWQLTRLAAKLLDDVEDGSIESGQAVTVNVATGILAAAPLALWKLAEQDVPPDRIRRVIRMLHHTTLRACAGQHADLMAGQAATDDADLDAWLEIAQRKSGAPFAWAAWAGALVAGANEPVMTCYCEYGRHLGILLQIADDFNGVWSSDGQDDLTTGRPTLPVCYALQVTRGEKRNQLLALLQRAAQNDDAAKEHARQLLVDAGAQAYMLMVGRVQRQHAVEALQRAGCPSPTYQHLVALIDQIMPALRTEKS